VKEAEVRESARVLERAGEVENVCDDEDEDMPKNVDGREESEVMKERAVEKELDVEMVGTREVIDMDGEEARGAEVTTIGTQETTAAKPDMIVATSGTNVIQGAKESKEAEETPKVRRELRLMMPGRHDFRKVLGPVHNFFYIKTL
jgi:hypothetical protein